MSVHSRAARAQTKMRLAPDKGNTSKVCGCEVGWDSRSLYIRKSGSNDKVLRDWLHLVDKGANASCLATGQGSAAEVPCAPWPTERAQRLICTKLAVPFPLRRNPTHRHRPRLGRAERCRGPAAGPPPPQLLPGRQAPWCRSERRHWPLRVRGPAGWWGGATTCVLPAAPAGPAAAAGGPTLRAQPAGRAGPPASHGLPGAQQPGMLRCEGGQVGLAAGTRRAALGTRRGAR